MDKNIQMRNRNANNDGWDFLYPLTLAKNVMDSSGEMVDNSIEFLKNSKEFIYSSLDYQTPIAETVTSIQGGAGSRFPQSMCLDSENDRYYVARQTSGQYNDQMIYEYRLSDNALLRNKSVPTSEWVYLEGLPLFHNGYGEICFIIPVERSGKFGIFNFDTGFLVNEFEMEGSFKTAIDNNHKYFICSKHSDYNDLNNTFNGFLLYDLHSVIDGTPKLIKKIECNHDDISNPKTQTVTMIDDLIYLGQGVRDSSVTVIDTAGNKQYFVTYDKREVLILINGNSSEEDPILENEGMHFIKENGKTYPVVGIATQGRFVLIKLGDIKGKKIPRSLNGESTNGLARISENPALNMFGAIGNAILRVESSQDFYEEVLKLKGNGLYTFFMSGTATNGTVGGASVRGLIQIDRFANGVPSILSVIGQDFRGGMWANYYDDTADGWIGWSHIGGHSAQVSGETFDPLSDSVNAGYYETQSGINAPTNTGNYGTIREYHIRTSGNGRKQVICTDNDRDGSDTFINTRKTDGTWTGWKKFTTS